MDCHRGNKGPAKGGSDTRVKSTCPAVKGSPSLSPSRALTRGGLGLNRRGEWQCSGVGDSSPQLCHCPSISTPSLALEYQVASPNDGGRGSSESAFCSSVKCEDPLVRFSRVTILRRTKWRSFVEAASPSDSPLPPRSEIVMSGDCPLVWHVLSTLFVKEGAGEVEKLFSGSRKLPKLPTALPFMLLTCQKQVACCLSVLAESCESLFVVGFCTLELRVSSRSLF
jgi:hypothetical protein